MKCNSVKTSWTCAPQTTSFNLNLSLFSFYCVVLKPLALYTRLLDMGKRNKVVKLTKKKIDYIIRAKTRNDSNKNIAVDMKISKSTVKRVWTHWLIHKGPIPIKKFGRKKQVTDEKSVELIIQVQKEQKR